MKTRSKCKMCGSSGTITFREPFVKTILCRECKPDKYMPKSRDVERKRKLERASK